MTDATSLDQYVESLPTSEELRDRLAKNIGERGLIKRLLKLSEIKERHADPESESGGSSK